MPKFLYLFLLFLTAPQVAEAGFIVSAVTAAISTIGGWLAAGGVTGFIANTAAALLASAVQMKIAANRAKGQQDVFLELLEPDSLPVYRFVYGNCWAPGTPAPVRVKDDKIYACFILNSRPSQGPFKVFFDKRELVTTGDPYDFAGPGATGTNGDFGPGTFGPHVWIWIGRGDQTGPPATFISEAPEFFRSTDRWRGLTVLWVKLRAGSEDDMPRRWPSAPPEVMVEGNWSLVWDPRDPTQIRTDPTTHKFSRNQALCVLDALLNNPVNPYPVDHLWLDSFSWAADVADMLIPVKTGPNIPRFRVNGVLAFSEGVEIEDQVNPLLAAGASRWIRAYGQLGMLPAIWTSPVGVISEVLDEQDMVFERWRDGTDLYTEAYAIFTSPARAYESAPTPAYKVEGAQTEDRTGPRALKLDLPFVHDHRQAQYISKIEVMRSRMQKSISFMGTPETLNYISGANVTMALPAPYGTSRNGNYMIEESSPFQDPTGTSGVGFRNPMTVRENDPQIYLWNTSEEQDIPEESFDPNISTLPPVASLSAVSGATTAVTSGNSSLPRIRFEFPPLTGNRASRYEWQYEIRREGGGFPIFEWQTYPGGFLDPTNTNELGNLEEFTGPLSLGREYRVKVRPLGGPGVAPGPWRTSPSIFASVGPGTASAPTPLSATSVANGIQVSYRTPNEDTFSSMEIFMSATNNLDNAALLFGPISSDRNTVVNRTHTGLSDGQTRYYWARSIDRRGIASSFSPVLSATFEEA